MTNPTSNFGWQMPTPADLVTDLPADFEVFGQAVDTTLADLKGGTTGQVLTKATNTNMDFTWVTPQIGDITAVNAGTGITGGGTTGDVTITNSMATAIDAKGDLIVGTAADTFARLAVGTNGQVLKANSATATGLEWATDTGDIEGVTAGTGLTGGGTSGTVTLSIDSTVATLTGSQTLTNKTLTAPVISTISNSGTVTIPTGTDTLVNLAGSQTLTNKTLTLPVINNTRTGYSTTVTAAGTTTLTSASNKLQFFTGTTTQTVVLPATSTLALGVQYEIHNNSTGIVTVQSSGLAAIQAIPAGHTYLFTVIDIVLTTAAAWDKDFMGGTTVTGTGNVVAATSPTLTTPVISSIVNTGTLTLPTTTDTLVGRATTDTLTNKTLTSPILNTPNVSTLTTNGDLLYGTGSGNLARLGIGSANQVLTVAGGIPSWATPASSGGFTLLSTTNITAVNTVSITSINQTYKHLFVTVSDFTTNSNGDNIELLLKTSGGTALNSQIVELAFNGTNPPSGAGNFYGGATTIARDVNSSTGAGANVNGTSFWVFNYALSIQKSIWGSYNVYGVTNGNYRAAHFGGSTYATAGANAISTLEIRSQAGSTFRATGTVRIWGVN